MKTLILILTSLCFFNIKNYSRDISIFDNFWTENLLVNNNQNIPLYFNSNQVNDKFIKDTIVSKFISYDEVNFCAVGIGTGSSYGSIGVKFQKRHGRNIGFGYHFGFGYLLDSKYIFNLGLKFYPYKWFYINPQFGIVCLQNEYRGGYLSILSGVDIYLYKRIGLNGGIGTRQYWGKHELIIDLGLFYSFH